MALFRKRTRESKLGLIWFFNEIKKSAKDFSYNAFNPTKDPFIGSIFFFQYIPKYKDVLPVWDRFPCVIPISLYDDGILGLNLHYLPIPQRTKLLKYLMKYKTTKNRKVYMNISYNLLKSVSKMPEFEVCIHRYLTTHMRSRLVRVNDSDWMKVAILPAQQFVGKAPY